MNYYLEMVQDFVTKELKKESGAFLDDGEFCYACGLAYRQIICQHIRKAKQNQLRQDLLSLNSLPLLKANMLKLLELDEKTMQKVSRENVRLISLLHRYTPKKIEIDSVLQEVLVEGMDTKLVRNKYERQERYQKKVGSISKTYKLNQEVVEDFAKACKKKGVSLGSTLTELMQSFIDENL